MSGWLTKIREFITETLNELRKCSWPARNELFESTILVIVAVLLLAIFVVIVDLLSMKVINLLTM